MRYKIFIWTILLLSLSSCNSKKEIHKGDYYLIRTQEGHYTTWLIDSISKKYIWYIPSDLEVHDSLYLDSLTSYRLYTDKPHQLKKKDFKRLSLHQWQPKTTTYDK
jgi:hypothetical protein